MLRYKIICVHLFNNLSLRLIWRLCSQTHLQCDTKGGSILFGYLTAQSIVLYYIFMSQMTYLVSKQRLFLLRVKTKEYTYAVVTGFVAWIYFKVNQRMRNREARIVEQVEASIVSGVRKVCTYAGRGIIYMMRNTCVVLKQHVFVLSVQLYKYILHGTMYQWWVP